MAKYKGSYTDKFREIPIDIYNDFETLSFHIGKMEFRSRWLDDIQLTNHDSFSAAELHQYRLRETPILLTDGTKLKSFDLYDCGIRISIPSIIVEVSSLIEHEVSLDIMVTLGSINPNGCLDKLQLDALFIFLAKEYVVSTTKGDFETLFCRFQQQIGDEYYFKNCFGCLYSDYSPYGQTFFGGMLCFENQKEAYLKVVDKNDILNLDTEKKYVQEIYCCNLFCKRIKGIGYRG